MRLSPLYLLNNSPKILGLTAYVACNFLLFGVFANAAAGDGLLIQLAKGTGACLNLGCSLLLLGMARLGLSRLRKTFLADFLPLEKATNFHRLVGHVTFILAVIHSLAYVVSYRLDGLTPAAVRQDAVNITGALAMVLYALVWVFARSKRRRKTGGFELFVLSHLLAIPFVLVLMAHSWTVVAWLALPATAYLCDRAIRFYRMRVPALITAARILPSEVIELEVQRPVSFRYRAGDYVFVMIPLLSSFEWHALTISSHPERTNVLTFHIRSLGDWSGKLFHVFSQWTALQRASLQGAALQGANQQALEGVLAPNKLALLRNEGGQIRLHMDGPHGTPSNDIFRTGTAVLIAAGIGVTPFASILQSLLARRDEGPSKVYFYWVNRDHRAFEWFVDLVANLQKQQPELFEMELYITGPHPKPDGTGAKTIAGRPDFESLLTRIAGRHDPMQTTVFYCGPRGLGATLKQQCRSIGFRYKKENF